MASLPLSQQVLPTRQAAKQASASISQQIDESGSDSLSPHRKSPQNRVMIKYGKKGKALRTRKALEQELKSSQPSGGLGNSNLGKIGLAPRPKSAPNRHRKGQTELEKKPPLELDCAVNGLSDSDLTPISPSELSTPEPPTSSPNPPSQTPRPFPLSAGTDGLGSSVRKKRKRQDEPYRRKLWKKKELSDYVWVLIDDRSRAFDYSDEAALDREYIWWPGKISRSSPGLGGHILLVLYNQIAPNGKSVEVPYPTEDNVLPLENLAGDAQFRAPTYVTPSHQEPSKSPRKKAKRDRGDLEQRWHAAVLELNADRQRDEPGPSTTWPTHARGPDARPIPSRDTDEESLPEVGEGNWKASLASIPPETPREYTPKAKRKEASQSRARGHRKAKQKAPLVSEDECNYRIQELEEIAFVLADEPDWLIPPADETLQIPGELVIAIGTGGDRVYWPARVLEYIPPKSRKEKEGKYKLEYLDRTTAVLKRNSFYTSEEDGFATCKLGQFESSYDETANDSETEEPLSQSWAPSPIPSSSPPSREDFCELDVRAQFIYTKPILIAILNEQYPPAKERHDNFLKGGLARKSAVDGAALRGEMDPRSVSELQKWLCYWCLRDEGSVSHGKEDTTVNDSVHELQNGQVEAAEMAGVSSAGQGVTWRENRAWSGQAEGTDGSNPRAITGDHTPESKGCQTDKIAALEAPSQETLNEVCHDDTQWQDTSQPPSSLPMDATMSLSQDLPNCFPADVSMEEVKSINQDSSLSPLQESMRGTTPMSVENKEGQPTDPQTDMNDAVSDLTELDSPASPSVRSTKITKATETGNSLPRQYGCAAFEALSIIEKLDYCLNVLLPEAVIQILLWRKGLRSTMVILSLNEEERMHDKGIKLLQVTDWVFDVMRLRRSRERSLEKTNGVMSNSQKSERGGGRLRKVGRVNYLL